MRCSDVTRRASDLIDGTIGGREAMRLRLHILFCKSCARFLRQMRQTGALTRAALGRTEPVDPVLLETILERARHRQDQ